MENLPDEVPQDQPESSLPQNVWNEVEWDPELWSTWPTVLETLDDVDLTSSTGHVDAANIGTQIPNLNFLGSTYAAGSGGRPRGRDTFFNTIDTSQSFEVSMWTVMIIRNTKLSLTYRHLVILLSQKHLLSHSSHIMWKQFNGSTSWHP